MRRIKSITLYRDYDARLNVIPIVTFFTSLGIRVREYDLNTLRTVRSNEKSKLQCISFDKIYSSTDFSVVWFTSTNILDSDSFMYTDKIGWFISDKEDDELRPTDLIRKVLDVIDKCLKNRLSMPYKYQPQEIPLLREDIKYLNALNDVIARWIPGFFDVVEFYKISVTFHLPNYCMKYIDELIRELSINKGLIEHKYGKNPCLNMLINSMTYRKAILSYTLVKPCGNFYLDSIPGIMGKEEQHKILRSDEFFHWIQAGEYKVLPNIWYRNYNNGDDPSAIIPNDYDISINTQTIVGNIYFARSDFKKARSYYGQYINEDPDILFKFANAYYGDYMKTKSTLNMVYTCMFYRKYVDVMRRELYTGNLTAIELYQLYKATRYLTNAPMKPKKASTKSIDRNRNLPKIYGSDKPIRSFIRKYCDLYHLCFGYYEVLDNVFYSL